MVYKSVGGKWWGVWLGTGRVANQDLHLRTFHGGREFARGLGLGSRLGWIAYAKANDLPADIPANPPQTYANEGWSSWGDWLGTGRVSNRERTFRTFFEARKFARNLGLESGSEWKAFVNAGNLPDDIPRAPDSA